MTVLSIFKLLPYSLATATMLLRFTTKCMSSSQACHCVTMLHPYTSVVI